MVLTLTEPNAEHWWVSGAQNTLRWTGGYPREFAVYMTHPDPSVMSTRLVLLRSQPINQHHKIITPYGFKPGPGYVLEFSNVHNPKDIYVYSQPFEIKAVGSTRSPPPTPIRPELMPNEFSSAFSGTSSTSSVASHSVSAHRVSDGNTTHLTFEYGGAYVAGVHAAGLLCEDFRHVSLKEVESGTEDGWIKLSTPKKPGRGGKFVVGRSRPISVASGSVLGETMAMLAEVEPEGGAVGEGSRETVAGVDALAGVGAAAGVEAVVADSGPRGSLELAGIA